VSLFSFIPFLFHPIRSDNCYLLFTVASYFNIDVQSVSWFGSRGSLLAYHCTSSAFFGFLLYVRFVLFVVHISLSLGLGAPFLLALNRPLPDDCSCFVCSALTLR
jgi:hypothetical protein